MDHSDYPIKMLPEEIVQYLKRKRELSSGSANTVVQGTSTGAAVVHEMPQKNKSIVLFTHRQRFRLNNLISAEDNPLSIQQVLQASIPSITIAAKWRVVCMNLQFTHLSLAGGSYIIKYDSIMKAVQLAQEEKITVVMKSDVFDKNYIHSKFGIYCVENHPDKFFVGPYFLHENHNLDSLISHNGVLMSISLFKQSQGKNVPGSGFWFYQMSASEQEKFGEALF